MGTLAAKERRCFDCSHELPLAASFCANCGRQVRKRPDRPSRKAQKLAEEEALRQQGRDKLEEYRLLIKDRTIKRNRTLRFRALWVLFVYICILICIRYGSAGANYTVAVIIISLVAFFTVIFVLSGCGDPNRWLSSDEYYSFSGSMNESGSHRCIFCGWRGIYRSGKYQTSNTYSRCSSCGSGLFVE
jgi:hypothetical protein